MGMSISSARGSSPAPGALLSSGKVIGGAGATYANLLANAPSPVSGAGPTRNAQGDYTLTFTGVDVSTASIIITGNSGGSTQLTFDIISQTATTIRVQIFQAGALSNASFQFLVFAQN